MKNPLWFIIWLVILVIVGFPVAFFCAGWYVVLYPLTVCIPALSVSLLPHPIGSNIRCWHLTLHRFFHRFLQGLTDFLLQGTQFTHYAAQSMMECRSLF